MSSKWETDVVGEKKKPCPCGMGFEVENEVRYSHNNVPRVEYKKSHYMDCPDCRDKYVWDSFGWISKEQKENFDRLYEEYREEEKHLKEYFFRNSIDDIVIFFEGKPKNALFKVLQKHHAVRGTEGTFRKHFRGVREHLTFNFSTNVVHALIEELHISDQVLIELTDKSMKAQNSWLKRK